MHFTVTNSATQRQKTHRRDVDAQIARASAAPSFVARQRAWETAYVLRQDHDERLTDDQRIRAEIAVIAGPASLGWPEIGEMLCVARGVIGDRE